MISLFHKEIRKHSPARFQAEVYSPWSSSCKMRSCIAETVRVEIELRLLKIKAFASSTHFWPTACFDPAMNLTHGPQIVRTRSRGALSIASHNAPALQQIRVYFPRKFFLEIFWREGICLNSGLTGESCCSISGVHFPDMRRYMEEYLVEMAIAELQQSDRIPPPQSHWKTSRYLLLLRLVWD
jgi:hypothetical protein